MAIYFNMFLHIIYKHYGIKRVQNYNFFLKYANLIIILQENGIKTNYICMCHFFSVLLQAKKLLL